MRSLEGSVRPMASPQDSAYCRSARTGQGVWKREEEEEELKQRGKGGESSQRQNFPSHDSPGIWKPAVMTGRAATTVAALRALRLFNEKADKLEASSFT